ncbi:AbrB/MazE/SpoVT family DNA-binding domain-containing protein [Candidatus Woesearchaeota archaeon]|nr:AbrB/MazE/SpoVT family DNA-binding domain-containing protein [Candidatus Woesearchaeota archaeon]
MGISKITRNFQVTLPRDVRELKNLRVGEKVLFVIEGSRVDLVKIDKNIIKDAAGLWAGQKETGIAYEARLRKGWVKRQAA